MFEVFEIFTTTLDASELCRMNRARLHDAAKWVERTRSALDAYEAQMMTAIDTLSDGGTDSTVLVRNASGCSQREARRRARRAEALAKMPSVAEALSGGGITAEHADVLVRAAEATSPARVDADQTLLAEAESLPADLAGRAVGDWVRRHQQVADDEAKFRQQRATRNHRFWVSDDGMVNSHASLDPVTGARVRAIVDDIANQLYETDGGRESGADQKRTWRQRYADALAIAVGAEPGPNRDRSVATSKGRDRSALSLRNQILVVAHTDVITGVDSKQRCEIVGTGPIPRSELDRLACGADLFGMLFDGDGLPLWHGRRLRTVSPQQWRVLQARDRGCVLCGANPAYCHAHHIMAWSSPTRGPTDIENLALVCNRHHHQIHQQNLTLTRDPDNRWTARHSTSRDPTGLGPVTSRRQSPLRI